MFSLPIWTGAGSETDRFISGDTVIHDAAYWVPLLGAYQGARREEICGLLVSDIDYDSEIDIHYMRLEDSEVRRLKNDQSKRSLPLHSELIRLGFIEDVEALRACGERILFPELRAQSAATPMGDVFDGSWQKIRANSLPNAKDEGKVFHSFRHWCNNEMKQVNVAAEIRRDILGHINTDVNEGRYAEIARLRVMLDALEQLPRPTENLERHPIRLLSSIRRPMLRVVKS